jgi:hypothetical protein
VCVCVCVCEGGAGGLSARELSVREGENCEGGERERERSVFPFFHLSGSAVAIFYGLLSASSHLPFAEQMRARVKNRASGQAREIIVIYQHCYSSSLNINIHHGGYACAHPPRWICVCARACPYLINQLP